MSWWCSVVILTINFANYINCKQISVNMYDQLSPISPSGIKRDKMTNKVNNQEHTANVILNITQ